jgi:hypothetical protein
MPDSRPLALSDQQLDAVMCAAAPLRPADRDPFLILVAQRLNGHTLGDGLVARVCREVQAEFWNLLDGVRTGTGKYR